MKLAGVVVLYNPEKNVKEKIKTYLNEIEKLYVIDNSKEQNNFEKLPHSPKIQYINNHKNLGIARALNIGCQKAIKENFDYILTMDQDSEFEELHLKNLIHFVEEHPSDLIGIYSPYHLIESNLKRPKLKIEHPIEVMTSGNILNLKAYEKVGGFKDWLFIDCVDIELCMNLRVNGYDIIRLNEVELKHKLGDSQIHHFLWKTLVCSNHNAFRRYFIARNCYYIYDMYHEYFEDYCAYIKGGIKYQVRNIILAEKDKKNKIKNIIRGIKDYENKVKGNPFED